MRLSHLLSVLVFSFAVWFTMAHIFVQGEFLTGRSLQAAAAGTVADTVIDFDDLPLNTVVSTQYHNEGGTDAGVDFVQGFQAGTLPVIAQVAAGEAPSGTQIGKITFICPRPECPGATNTTGRFQFAKQQIQVSVGAFGTAANTIRLLAFDASGLLVAEDAVTVTGGTGFRNQLAVRTSSPRIASFRVQGSTVAPIGIDDLTFDNPETPPPPDFALSLVHGPIEVVQGESAVMEIAVARINNSTGNIRLHIDPATLPARVTVSPQVVDTAAPERVRITFTLAAAQDAAPVAGQLVTVVATPSGPAAGPAPKTLEVPVSVLAAFVYDLRIRGIEVTQGISFAPVLRPEDADSGGRVYQYPFMLYAGGKTIVRVYADNALPTPAGGVEGVSMRLYGFHGETGSPLQGSPLSPELGKRTLTSRIDLAQARQDPDGAFTFTLPWNWTEGFQPPGTVSLGFPTVLRAELVPPRETPTLKECEGCQANNTFTLSDVHYHPTSPFRIAPLRLRVQGASVPTAQAAFRQARRMTPTRIEVPNYLGTINITDIVQSGKPLDDQQAEAIDRVFHWFENNRSAGNMAIGVAPAFAGLEFSAPLHIAGRVVDFPYCVTFVVGQICGGPPIAVVNANRPLTSVAHELHHGLGRPHASPCGGGGANGQVAESWPPDQQGSIQGVGLDVRTNSGGDTGPYRLIAPGLSGQPAQWYDFMSYCASTADNDSWISTHGWRDLIQMLSRGASHDFITPFAAAAQPEQALEITTPSTVTAPTLIVHGWVGSTGTVTITAVSPYDGQPAEFAPSPFHLVVRDAAGEILSDTPMYTVSSHVDGGGVLTFLWHEVPASGAASVEITLNGVGVAQRVRSPNAPQVAILSPQPGEQIEREGDFVVRWEASDADGDPLMVTIDYSTDDGQSFRTLYVGPNENGAVVPSADLAGAESARIRVRVNDGFNETTALSAPFNVLRAPPSVTIEAPADGQRIMQNAALYLSGEGFDDAFQPIAEENLCWSAGSTPIGCGAQLSTTGLAPGLHDIRLVAQDAQGLSDSAAVTVEVLASDEVDETGTVQSNVFLPLISGEGS